MDNDLKKFVKDIADTFRSISGSQELIDPQDFSVKAQDVADDVVKKNLEGSATSLTASDFGSASVIRKYAFGYYNTLASIEIPEGVNVIRENAFDYCQNVQTLSLPSSLTRIYSQAFAHFGYTNQSSKLALSLNGSCQIDAYAFQASNIVGVSGTMGNIGLQAFCQCPKLKTINIGYCGNVGDNAFSFGSLQDAQSLQSVKISMHGTLGDNVFNYCRYIKEIDFSESVITSLPVGGGTRRFGLCIGASRSASSTNVLTYDFRNSTFTDIPSYFFAGMDLQQYYNNYMVYRFPVTLETIGSSAFANNRSSVVIFYGDTIPSLSNSNTFNNFTGMIWVPYQHVGAWRDATNWTGVASNIYGFAPGGTFNQGDTLPTHNEEGYELVWHDMMWSAYHVVTTVEDETAELFCTVSDTLE